MATTSVAKPSSTKAGARLIRRKLKIAGLKTIGSSLPPPLMVRKPKKISPNPRSIRRKFFRSKSIFLIVSC